MVSTIETIQDDQLAMTVARVLAVANQTASGRGIDLAQSLITITEESPPSDHLWRVHYGPRDFVNRRGGDLMILIDGRQGEVRQILLGQ